VADRDFRPSTFRELGIEATRKPESGRFAAGANSPKLAAILKLTAPEQLPLDISSP